MNLLQLENIEKTFRDPNGNVAASVFVPSLQLNTGEMMILEGPSGSGKTTLLHIISGLLKEDAGTIMFDGKPVQQLKKQERDAWRAENIGYIFQKLNLLDALTVEENIILAEKWRHEKQSGTAQRVSDLLEQVGLKEKGHMKPCKLSLGEQQRVALLRAVFNRPRLLLADEPTASLDRHNTDIVLRLLQDLCRKYGIALLLSTHDEYVKSRFSLRYSLMKGGADHE